MGCSVWGGRELDTTEATEHTCTDSLEGLAGVQPRWIQGIRSGTASARIRKQLLN